MERILECIPNFSEGQNKATINQIANEISQTDKVKLLHVDIGESANRTVMTFAGEPHKVVEAAYKATKKAVELIDMRKHEGVHPRFGAIDVCPFVPLSGISMEETVLIARNFGKTIANDFNLHVYCYENAAYSEVRKKLENCRRGEYEGLPGKLEDPDWKPDYGSVQFNAKSGAIAIGARNFLIAFNINLNTKSVELAKKIAGEIRESGTRLKKPGKLRYVKAIGWYLPDHNVVQVSTNITNPDKVSIFNVYQEVVNSANRHGIEVTGSEIVGMIPKKHILGFNDTYIDSNVNENELINLAIDKLRLNNLYPFDPDTKIIEFALNQ